MKIKLAYPKIPDTLNCPLKQCIAFEKIDGTCMAFYWNGEEGFHSFGTRRDRFAYHPAGFAEFHQAHPGLEGLEKTIQTIEQPLTDFLTTNYYGAEEAIIFTEFHGLHSFAGTHNPKEEKRLTIFDVEINGRLMPPEQFIKLFEPFGTPKVVFQGKFTGQLFMDVRAGKYSVQEGVVVKGMVNGQVYMAKIKTQAYLDRLKKNFGNDWKEYGE